MCHIITWIWTYLGRNVEPKRLAHLPQVKLVDVKDALERVGGVSLEVGSVAVSGGLMQVVIFGDEFFQLHAPDFTSAFHPNHNKPAHE